MKTLTHIYTEHSNNLLFLLFPFFRLLKKQLFEQSLFNRLYSIRMSPDEENKEGVTVLKTQYRMAKAICEWPSKYFYDGKMVTAESLIRHGPCNEYR